LKENTPEKGRLGPGRCDKDFRRLVAHSLVTLLGFCPQKPGSNEAKDRTQLLNQLADILRDLDGGVATTKGLSTLGSKRAPRVPSKGEASS
jgi:hypothetical protein